MSIFWCQVKIATLKFLGKRNTPVKARKADLRQTGMGVSHYVCFILVLILISIFLR